MPPIFKISMPVGYYRKLKVNPFHFKIIKIILFSKFYWEFDTLLKIQSVEENIFWIALEE